MDLNELQQTRLGKLERLRAAGIEPFPPRAARSHTAAQVLAVFDALAESQVTVALAGRIMLRRVMGGSSFVHIADESGRIQIFLSKKDLGADAYKLFAETTDIGDIIGVQGYAFRTKTGEPSVFVQRWQMLAKTLNPLPEKHAGLTDIETRYASATSTS